jgi:hypothetical protein
MRLRLFILGVLAASALAGCSTGSSPGTGSGPAGATVATVDPCDLVSGTELATTIGAVKGDAVTLTQTKHAEEFRGRTCVWTYPNKEVVTDTGEVRITAWRGLEFYTPHVTPESFTAVAGIGDEADASPSMFMFRKGEDVFLVHVSGDAARNKVEPAIAKLVISKL